MSSPNPRIVASMGVLVGMATSPQIFPFHQQLATVRLCDENRGDRRVQYDSPISCIRLRAVPHVLKGDSIEEFGIHRMVYDFTRSVKCRTSSANCLQRTRRHALAAWLAFRNTTLLTGRPSLSTSLPVDAPRTRPATGSGKLRLGVCRPSHATKNY